MREVGLGKTPDQVRKTLESMNRVVNQCYDRIFKTDQKSTNKQLLSRLTQETDPAFVYAVKDVG